MNQSTWKKIESHQNGLLLDMTRAKQPEQCTESDDLRLKDDRDWGLGGGEWRSSSQLLLPSSL